MPVTIKYDLEESELIGGVSSYMYDAATRIAYVEGLDDDNIALKDAFDAIVLDAGLTHQGITDLPLAKIRLKKYGPDTAFAILQYGRRRSNWHDQPSATVARFRSGHHPLEWYRRVLDESGSPSFSNWKPAGVINGVFAETFAIPQHDPYIYDFKVLHVHVPAKLGSNPISTVWSLVDKLNNAGLAFGGNTFAAYELRFDALDVDWEDGGGTAEYYVNYFFTAMPGGWLTQNVYWDDDAAPDPKWDTFEGLAYQTGDFSVIPYNT